MGPVQWLTTGVDERVMGMFRRWLVDEIGKL